MLQLGIIRPSSSAWSSPLHMVPKKTLGGWGPWGDYRSLNRITVPDCYPVPHVQDLSSTLQGTTIFSKLELVRALSLDSSGASRHPQDCCDHADRFINPRRACAAMVTAKVSPVQKLYSQRWRYYLFTHNAVKKCTCVSTTCKRRSTPSITPFS